MTVKKHTTLLLHSGGLDSTTCLFKLLSETRDDVHTFYVDVRNNATKVWCEQLAIKATHAIARSEFGEFTNHDSSTFNLEGCVKDASIQPYMWMFAAAMMLTSMDGKNKRLCLGYTHGDSAADELPAIQRLWRSTWKHINTADKCPPIYLPLIEQTKKDSMKYLRSLEKEHGVDVINKIWTCECPVVFHSPEMAGYKACHECQPCKRGLEIRLIKP